MARDIELKKRENETDEEFQFRICSLKKKKRLTWNEIAAIINRELGLTHDESRYRRRFGTFLVELEEAEEEERENKNNLIDDSEEKDVPFSKEEQEYRERYMLSAGKVGYYRLLRQDSHFARFYKLIASAIKELDPPNDLFFEKIETEKNKEYVMTLADLHIGACFEAVNNAYSIQIARDRFEILLNRVVAFVQEKKINKLNIVSLGDIVQGILRISDLKLNEAAVVDAFVVAMRLISEFLNKLSAYVEIVFYQVCYSNHDQVRPLGTKASELGSEDIGKVLYAYLGDVLSKNNRITIVGDTLHDYLEFKIFDFNCIALHGHQVKNARDIYKNLANRHHKLYDYIFLGHTHSMKVFVNAECKTYDAETLISSSFVGSDPYADKLMVGSKASVSIHEFEPKEGRVASYKIILN